MTNLLEDGPPVANPTDAERRVWAAFTQGELADLRTGDTEADNPRRAESWEASRQVRAEVVTALLLGSVEPAAGRVPRLRLAGALVEGTIDVRGGVVNCTVEMTGCRFTGDLVFAEARTRTVDLSESILDIMDASAAQTGGHLVLNRCQARTIDLSLAHITGYLLLDGARLTNRSGVALFADGLIVDGSMFGRNKFETEGEVRLARAHIAGNLELAGARLMAKPGGVALFADGLTIDGGMFCTERFQAGGEIRLLGAHIGGTLSLNGAILANPGGVTLFADGITVGASMFCGEGFLAMREVRLARAYIGGQLGFRGASLFNAGTGLALNCDALRADSLWLDDTTVTGAVNLTSAQVKVLRDDSGRWPPQMYIDGCTYESLEPYAGARGTSGRLAWLALAGSGYRAQPYEQLAIYYRQLGHDEEARRVLLAKQRARRSTLTPFGKAVGYLLDGLVGYGYRPGRAFTWLLVLLVAGSVYFNFHRPAPLDPAHHPHYQPVLYTAQLLIPLVNLGQSNVWGPAGAAQWIAGTLIGLGWVLGIAVVAGVTRVLTRV